MPGPLPSPDRVCLHTGRVLLATVALLILLLAVLPGRRSFVTDTVSSAAYGPQRGLVFAVLVLFGLATGSLALALALRLRGVAGAVCGSLVGVWAAAAVFDAFVRTTPHARAGTAFTQVHTMVAVAGIVAQVLAAAAFLVTVRRRTGRLPRVPVAVTAVVLAGVVFVAVHPDSLAGLSERLLIAASGGWMLVSVQAARRCSGPRSSRPARPRRTIAPPYPTDS